jgi:hypothetical protein
MKERRGAFKLLVGKPEGKKRPLGRSRGRCEEMLEWILNKSVVRVWS